MTGPRQQVAGREVCCCRPSTGALGPGAVANVQLKGTIGGTQKMTTTSLCVQRPQLAVSLFIVHLLRQRHGECAYTPGCCAMDTKAGRMTVAWQDTAVGLSLLVERSKAVGYSLSGVRWGEVSWQIEWYRRGGVTTGGVA